MRLCIGIGAADKVDRLIIRWPTGATQELTDLSLDQLHKIREPNDVSR
jgi:hypothetical protein